MPPGHPHQHIDVVGIICAEPEQDGLGLKLVLADQHDQRFVLTLTWACLGELLCRLPWPPAPPADAVSDVRAWHLDPPEPGGRALTLSLQTAQGQVAVFRLTAGQLAGMATVAMHTPGSAPLPRNVH
jgi:hypothetical protein